MEKIIEILESIVPDVDFSVEKSLVDDGIIDSLDIVTIISAINEVYGVSIPAKEIEADNFNSAQAIFELVERTLAKHK